MLQDAIATSRITVYPSAIFVAGKIEKFKQHEVATVPLELAK